MTLDAKYVVGASAATGGTAAQQGHLSCSLIARHRSGPPAMFSLSTAAHPVQKLQGSCRLVVPSEMTSSARSLLVLCLAAAALLPGECTRRLKEVTELANVGFLHGPKPAAATAASGPAPAAHAALLACFLDSASPPPTPNSSTAQEKDGYCDEKRYSTDPDCGGGTPATACSGSAGALRRPLALLASA